MAIDKDKVKKCFKRSINTYNDNAIVQRNICRHLMDIIKSYTDRKAYNVLEIGCGTGIMTDYLVSEMNIAGITVNDIVEDMYPLIKEVMDKRKVKHYNFLTGDAEQLIIDKKYDVIVSASVFQWFENPDIVMLKMSKMLKEGGLLVFNTYVSGNFREIKAISEGGLSYLSFEEMKEYADKYLEHVYSEQSENCLYFEKVKDVLKHLKYTGVNGVKAENIWTKSKMKDFERRYDSFYEEGKGYKLTYNPAYFVYKSR